MTYQTLYKKRDVWKGIAILWVMYFHLPHDFIFQPFLLKLQLYGYAGVDILLFASGIGCYYSLHSRPDFYSFFKRRITRILPAYWIFLVFWSIVQIHKNQISTQSILGNYLGIQFFTDQGIAFNWFISGILIMYVVAPYFYRFITGRSNFERSLLLVAFLLVFTIPWLGQERDLLLVSRIPIFGLGMCFGRLGIEERPFTKITGAVSLIICFIGMVILYLVDNYAYALLTDLSIGWTVFVLIAPGICFAASFLPDTIGRVFAFFGRLSLELFLMHLLMIDIRDLLALHALIPDTPLTYIVALLISVPFALFLKFLADFASSRLHFLLNRNIIESKGE
ncbi:MAG: acyltransferase [Lachnospiraceae bacterium]|nr:acyltransferase [Lachnospiraceae bacterium]